MCGTTPSRDTNKAAAKASLDKPTQTQADLQDSKKQDSVSFLLSRISEAKTARSSKH
ncbi:hypothetical protein PtB15_3B479 [Puccinia triticina]|nr:hypothetical protein PtB15_3B479 [Puccinia triticina]